jgi:hypothetical protein
LLDRAHSTLSKFKDRLGLLVEPGEDAKMTLSRHNHAFGSVLGLSAVVATTVMLAGSAVALERLLMLGGIDLRPILESTCDRVEKITDEAELQNLQKSILYIQARVDSEDGARVHADFEVSERFEAAKRKLTQLETEIEALRSKGSDTGRLQPALAQQKNVVETVWKAFQEADDKRKEAENAKAAVDEKVPVALKCILERMAAIKGDVIPQSTCFTTGNGSFPCEIRPTDANGSFEISAPNIKYIFNMAEPGVAWVFLGVGEKTVPLPGPFLRSKSEPACWENEAKTDKICLQS